VLCGLRNGSIAPVDVRQKHHDHPTGVPSASTARRTVPMLHSKHHERLKNQVCNTSTQHPLIPCILTSLN